MSAETITTKKEKSEAQIAEQIHRISNRIGERALLGEITFQDHPREGLYNAVGSDYKLVHRRKEGDVLKETSIAFGSSAELKKDVTDSEGYAGVAIGADSGLAIDSKGQRLAGDARIGGSFEPTTLTKEEIVSQSARILSEMRGTVSSELAAREKSREATKQEILQKLSQ